MACQCGKEQHQRAPAWHTTAANVLVHPQETFARDGVRMLPILMSLLTRSRMSFDGAISAGWRATMGALCGVDRQVRGTLLRNEDAPALWTASSCPPSAAAADNEEARAVAAKAAAKNDRLFVGAAPLPARSLPAPVAAAAGAAVVQLAADATGTWPATAARMKASAASSSSSSMALSTTAAAAAAARASASSSPEASPASSDSRRAALDATGRTAAPLAELIKLPPCRADAVVGSCKLLCLSPAPKDRARLESLALGSSSAEARRGSNMAARLRRALWEPESSDAAPDILALPDSARRYTMSNTRFAELWSTCLSSNTGSQNTSPLVSCPETWTCQLKLG